VQRRFSVPDSTTSYAPRSDATPDTELSTLANVYKFVLDCRANKEAAPRQSRPDDPERRSDEIRAKTSIP
jgi:hypothetical protein